MATFDEFITSLDRDFGEQGKGKPFEVFCKWFLQNDPKWSGSVEKVWLWDEYPNKWQGNDLGTDLVFRDNEGQIWAVQAKCYSQHRSTTKKDLNSFLADAGREQVHRMLWMQTTDNMEANAEASLKHRDKPVTIFKLTDFRDAQIDYPASFAELRKASVKPKPSPEPHQIEAIEAATKGLLDNDRGQMIMACGTGKTFTTLWVKEALKAHATLVLLPSLSLLSQTMREWAWAKNQDFKILNVCSDSSVGKKTEDMDPADAPFPVTSDVEEIALFLKKPEAKVVFCTYQSSGLIAQAQLEEGIPNFDLAVADEAHRCAGKADAGFATILDTNKIRANKRLFTTATPRYFGKAIKDEANARDLEVVGMDNEAVFGPVVHKLSFGEAIERELLTDYQVVIVGVDEPMVRQWIERGEIVATDPDNQTDARTLAAKIGLIKAIKDYDLQRVISFHSRVKGAKEFSEELADVINLVEPEHRPSGVLLSDYVSGEMKAGDRRDKVELLKSLNGADRGVLTNARCLMEGVDLPSLDGVAFIDPRGSQIEIIQAVGRAIRKVRGAAVQKVGTIVIPVFIERGDDHEASIAASNFKPVWDVLKALRSHDEVLAQVLDEYRSNMPRDPKQNREKISDKIILDLPTTIGVEFSAALRTVLVEATTGSWEFWFDLLRKYHLREGSSDVPQKHLENGLKLGSWVSDQRKAKPKMPLERVQRLDLLAFVWDALAQNWETGFQELVAFKAHTGHVRVPQRYVVNGFKLGVWVGTQRSTKGQMPQDRLTRLEAVGFAWDSSNDYWEEGFRRLQEFKASEGHFNIPQRFAEDGFHLGKWVSHQRTSMDEMPNDRKQRLVEIAFPWDALGTAWEEGFSKLLAFKSSKGHCQVPMRYKVDGFSLGQWVSRQRRAQNELSPARHAKLNDIGFVWQASTLSWEEGFAKLVRFREREGHCLVTSHHKEDEHYLGAWVKNQRSQKHKLSQDRSQRLQSLGFSWAPNFESWERGLACTIQFATREGHLLVPARHMEDGFRLGAWVSNQRHQRNKLSAERHEKLDAIGFVWQPLDSSWEDGLVQLQSFRAREGHCFVPAKHQENGHKLGAWLSYNRARLHKLSQERRQKLASMGVVWATT